jgi:hypothetical protein
MASTRGHLLVLGGNPLHGSDVLGSRMGVCLWDLSLGQHTGDGKLDGETFLGRTWMFFSGGVGEGKRNSRARLPKPFRRTTRVPNRPVYVIYYILRSGGFATACLQVIAKGVLDPRFFFWVNTCTVRLRPPVDLVHTLKMVKGLLLLVPSRTPGAVLTMITHIYLLYVVIWLSLLYVLCLLCVCYMVVI